jgi:hypothetical protein
MLFIDIMSGRPNYGRGIGSPTAPRGEFTGASKANDLYVPPYKQLTEEQAELANTKFAAEVKLILLQVKHAHHIHFDSLFERYAQTIRIVIYHFLWILIMIITYTRT